MNLLLAVARAGSSRFVPGRIAAALIAVVLLQFHGGQLIAAAGDRPNFILCMADDQGWGDVAYNGHKVLKTPVLDAMAKSGLRFDNFYAAAPVCSPTRGSVLTGRHPNRFGCFSWGHTLRPQEVTLAEALKTAGYTTGHFGKWHLGPVRKASPVSPGNSGFDEWASSPNFYENDPWLSHNGKAVRTNGESSMVTVDLALKFIRKATAEKKPFLAVVWFGSPHSPHVARPELQKLYPGQTKRLRNYYGEITGIDRALGRLRAELRRLKAADNTLLWYTSDNGARRPGSTGGLRGRKGSLYEGGLRVPAIIEWPARIKSPKRTSLSCSTVDIYPTLLSLAGVKVAHQPILDGQSLVRAIDGTLATRDKPLGFWQYPTRGRPVRSTALVKELYAEQAAGKESEDPKRLAADAGKITMKYPTDTLPGHSAWIDGDYKLHRIAGRNGTIRFALYNLKKDAAETTDVIVGEPARAARMKTALAAWQRSVVRSLNGRDYPAH
ncbi:MAG: sulfatase-like hydrolase/transferase [Planctomycetaceae bacterium]